MSTMAGALGIVTLAGGVVALLAGDRVTAIDCFVLAGVSFAVWGVTRRRNTPPAQPGDSAGPGATPGSGG
jgi:hypothetical protein